VGVGVGVGVRVGVAVDVGVVVAVGLGDAVAVSVGVGVGVAEGVAVGVPVGVGVGVAPVPTTVHGENSDVLCSGSVAVAVTNCPTGTVAETTIAFAPVKSASPLASVVTVAEPRNASPSPYVDGSQAEFLKNSTVTLVFAVLSRLPSMVNVPPPVVFAAVSMGKFCNAFGPGSPSK